MKCPNCGGELRFDPATGRQVCDFCDSSWDIETGELKKPKKVTEAEEHKESYEQPEETEQSQDNTYDTVIYTCPNCGGQLLTTEETMVTFCSYCGSSNMLAGRAAKAPKPDCVIPFSVTREQCEEAYRKVLGRALFAPGRMAKQEQIERFRGIYMPYWMYDLEAYGKANVIGKQSHRSGDYIITNNYNMQSEVDGSYENISFDASAAFSDSISDAIAPFNANESKEFDPAYLTGFYADMSDVDSSVYKEEAKALVKDNVAQKILDDPAFVPYETERSQAASSVPVRVSGEKMGFFPVWFLACRSSDGTRVSYAAINGQTGKVAADIPVDFKKYLLGSCILAIPIVLLLNIFISLTAPTALIVAMCLAVFSMILLNAEIDKVYTRENRLDDAGLSYKNDPDSVKKKKGKSADKGMSSKKLSGIVIGVIVAAVLVLGQLDGVIDWFFDTPEGNKLGILIIIVAVAAIVWSKMSGRTSVRRKTAAKAPVEMKKIPWIRTLVVVIAGIVIMFISPFEDTIYYAADIIIMVIVGWTILDIIKAHNKLTMRKPVQLESRGGDEYEG